MKMKKACKQFIAVVVLLAGAFRVSAAVITADFNAYTAPEVISENTSSGTAINDHAALQDSSAGGTFTVWGSTGVTGSYSLKVLGDNTGSNYLNLSTTRTAGSPIAQVSTTATKSLSENWGVNTRFSATAANGSLYFGLYAGGAMSATGGYGITQVISPNNAAASTALSLIIANSGNARIVRTGTANIQEFWDSSTSAWTTSYAWALTGLDVTGATQYEVALSTDGTTMNVSLINAATSISLLDFDSSISDLGSNISTDGTIRFSAGDIANDSTDGWNVNIYSLSQIPEPATIGLMGFATVGLLGIRKFLSK